VDDRDHMADGRNRAALEPVEVIVTHSSPSFPNQCLQFVHNNHATHHHVSQGSNSVARNLQVPQSRAY
jgi:hypothetical protein